jgi:hypothetical protein
MPSLPDVLTGCFAYGVPYAYQTNALLSGDTCDPNADGGAP